MNSLQIFKNKEFGNLRAIEIDGEPWFVGKDVASALGFANNRDAIATHVFDEDKGVELIDTLGGKQKMTIINESGVYAMIFGSQLESAKKYKHWVTSEVLPAIRKTGSYELPDMSKELQAIFVLDKRTVEMDKRMDRLEFDIPLYGAEADELSKHVKRKGVSILGGKKSNAYNDASISSKLYRDIYGQMKREYGLYGDGGQVMTYKAIQRKNLDGAHKFVDTYEPPMYLKALIEDANSQMNMEM